MENIKKNRIKNVLLLTACSVCAVVAVFFPLIVIVLPGFIAACIAKNEKPSVAAATVCLGPVLALAVLYGVNSSLLCALPMAVLSSVGGTLIYYLQKKKTGGFDTVLYTSILMGAMIYLSIALPGVISGEGAFTSIKNTLTQLVEMLADYLTANIENITDSASVPAVIEGYRALPAMIVSMIVPFCCGIAGFLSLGNFLFFRLFVKKHREELGLKPVKPFRMWSVPKYYISGVAIFLLGSWVLELTGSEAAYSVMMSGTIIMSIPLAISGIALIDWLLVKRCDPAKLKKRRILIYILIGIFFQFTYTLWACIGMVDEFFRFRERVVIIRHPGGKGGIPNPFKPRKPEDDGSDPKENDKDDPDKEDPEEK